MVHFLFVFTSFKKKSERKIDWNSESEKGGIKCNHYT